MSEMNLLQETIEKMASYGKSIADVVWCGDGNGWFTWEAFAKVADITYSNEYGGNEIAGSLVVVGSDWWLERGEYDGSEWWEYKTLPKKPSHQKVPISVKNRNYRDVVAFEGEG